MRDMHSRITRLEQSTQGDQDVTVRVTHTVVEKDGTASEVRRRSVRVNRDGTRSIGPVDHRPASGLVIIAKGGLHHGR